MRCGLLAESLPLTYKVQAAVTPQAVTTKMCQNIAKCALGGQGHSPPQAENDSPRDTGQMLVGIEWGTQLSQC